MGLPATAARVSKQASQRPQAQRQRGLGSHRACAADHPARRPSQVTPWCCKRHACILPWSLLQGRRSRQGLSHSASMTSLCNLFEVPKRVLTGRCDINLVLDVACRSHSEEATSMGKQSGGAGGQDIDSARSSGGSMLTYRCIFVMEYCNAGGGPLQHVIWTC